MKTATFNGFVLNDKERFYRLDEPSVSEGAGGYYFLSNDIIRHRPGVRDRHVRTTFVGVASPHFLHALSLAEQGGRLKRIIAVDPNLAQLYHLRRLCDFVCASQTRFDYISKLFKVDIASKEQQRLKRIAFPFGRNYTHGCRFEDGLRLSERRFWRSSAFDSEAFFSEYGLRAEPADLGLRIRSDVIGGFSAYYGTLLCCSRIAYDLWPFTAAFGSGFLRDDRRFDRLKAILSNTPVYFLNHDLAEVFEPLVLTNRYHRNILWASNLLSNYFVARHPKLSDVIDAAEDLGTRREPRFPELDLTVMQDEREKRNLKPQVDDPRRRTRSWSVHTKTFAAVAQHLKGYNVLEVVSVRDWIEKDGSISKLPNTDYMHVDEFETVPPEKRWDTILLHILVGHGVPLDRFQRIVDKALSMAGRLLVLEHNRDSTDFHRKRRGLTVPELEAVLKHPCDIRFCPGNISRDRNILAICR